MLAVGLLAGQQGSSKGQGLLLVFVAALAAGAVRVAGGWVAAVGILVLGIEAGSRWGVP